MQGLASLPHDAPSLHDMITSTLGTAGSEDAQKLCGHIEASKGPIIREELDSLPRDKDGQPLRSDYEFKLRLLKRFFQPEVIRLADGGDPTVPQDVVRPVVQRSLLLGAVGLNSKHGSQGLGRVLYRYNAANVLYQGGLALNPPDRWTYTLAETALVVVPQLRQAVADQLAQGEIIGADLVGPKVVVVNQQMDVFLDQANAVDTTDLALPDQWVYDEAQQREVREPAATFAGAIRDAAWGNKEKRPPQTAIQRVTDDLSS